MKILTKIVQGIVRGRTIELEKLAYPTAKEWKLSFRFRRMRWGDGLRHCAGALAGISRFDEDIKQILRTQDGEWRIGESAIIAIGNSCTIEE